MTILDENLAMPNCFLSRVRVFKCKYCSRAFSTFQALGGHLNWHKDKRSERKTHDCSICGLEFAIGQAVGGHMNANDKDLAMVNCYLLLSRAGEFVSSPGFICNKCNRGFKPFQALGGHRIGQKPKTHDCSICGLMFAMGLAVGRRMRRHRDGAHQKCGPPEVSLPELVTENGALCFDLNLTPYENDLQLWSSSYKTAFAV